LAQLSGRLEAGESIVVAVFGTNRQGGALLPHNMVFTPARYIPGSTAIVIVGKPQNVDPSIGRLTVGRLLVDYASATVKSSCSDISAASQVIVIGVRHSVDSPLIATRVMPKDDCQ
jgi:hypothetical protein